MIRHSKMQEDNRRRYANMSPGQRRAVNTATGCGTLIYIFVVGGFILLLSIGALAFFLLILMLILGVLL